MAERHKSKHKGFKTFRAPPELLDALERRAMQETIHTGKDVSGADLIRRGIGMVLDTPVPNKLEHRECLVVKGVPGTSRCLTCKTDFHAQEHHGQFAGYAPANCPKDGKPVRHG